MDEPFLLGVNYWPRRKAMYWWADFDGSEVAEEFDVIAGLGLGVVRIFLLWDDWQPDPATVDRQRLEDLEVVAGAAADRNLRLDVTFFIGHMSGPNWAPGWLLQSAPGFPSPRVRQVISGGRIVESGYHSMIHHPEAVAASEVLLRTVVSHFADHPGVWMWNLGNEPDLFAYPASPAAGRDWVRRMTGIIKDIDPIHPVTCGLHVDSLVTNNGFRVDQVFTETDMAVMHGYPMYADWARHPLDPDFMPFLCALVTALSGKPCLAEEWGGCTNPDGEESVMWEWTSFGEPRRQFMAGERELAEHVEEVLPRLVSAGAPGALMWCFADYAEALWDRPPCDLGGARHERHFGLVRPDGSVKPHAETLARFAATHPVAKPALRRIELDLSPDEYYQDPAGYARRLYAHFLEP